MKNKKIIILDFGDGITYIKDYDDSNFDDAIEFLVEHGFRENNCKWMIVDTLKIEID